MSADHDLAALAELCGILPRYHDLHGQERVTTPETQKALLAANGIDVSNDDAIRNSLADWRHQIEERWFPEEIIVESQAEAPLSFGLGATWHLIADGEEAVVAEGQPADHITLPPLPSGVYVLTATASGRTETVTVLATPRHLPAIDDLTGQARLWGMNFALYGLQSERNTGLGDFKDLAHIAQLAGARDAQFVGVNPLHNMGFHNHEAISPYSPSHRGFLNTAYIALDAIPGLGTKTDLSRFKATRAATTIQYETHKTAHNNALVTAFKTFKSRASTTAKSDFATFQSQGGTYLEDFARFEALSGAHGQDWRVWPDTANAASLEKVEFHTWLQWVANEQLAAAQRTAKTSGMTLGLYLDLAVGPRRDGAESWCEKSAIATGVSIGAPPDHLSPEGQNWDLAAFAPRKLKAQRYAPLRRILSQTMRHAGVIRIDHVLGLNRSFWIPDDGSPGGYIRQPFEALMAIIKIEAERNDCAVIGEDLGLVPDGFRDMMRGNGFYGYSVLQYEKDDHGAFQDPRQGPSQVLSCFATHDTPTVKGYETGRDIDWWRKMGWIDAETANDLHATRASQIAAFESDVTFETGVHSLLAGSNARLVAVQLDDILASVEAQNLPGTTNEHPNWQRKYPVPLEDLSNAPGLLEIAQIMRVSGRSGA